MKSIISLPFIHIKSIKSSIYYILQKARHIDKEKNIQIVLIISYNQCYRIVFISIDF